MTETSARRWGKAGVPLTDREIRARELQADREHLEAEQHQERDRQAWAAGHVRPYRITMALDRRSLYGPGVDEACGVAEPAVDMWEAGTLYPSWEQLCALADLCGVLVGFFMGRGTDESPPLEAAYTSLRVHLPAAGESRPFVPVFTPEAVAAAVGGAAPAAAPASASAGAGMLVRGWRGTGSGAAGGPGSWPAGESGRCAGCGGECHRYGAGGNPLCAGCRAGLVRNRPRRGV